MKDRLRYIDIAKGIGVTLVVLNHTDASFLMEYTSAFFVPLFFFCAGYTSHIQGSLLDNGIKRTKRLLKPYIFFNIILMLCFLHFSLREIVGIIYSRYCLYPLYITPNIKFFTTGNYPLWYLTSMIVSYWLYYFLVYHKRYNYIIILSYLLITALLNNLRILLPWSIDTAFLMALVMYGGYIVGKKPINQYAIKQIIYSSILLLIFYSFLFCIIGDVNISVRIYGFSFLTYFIAAIIGCMLTIIFSYSIERTIIGSFFCSLGKNSLTIFCMEIPFIYYGKILFEEFTPNTFIRFPLLLGSFELCFAIIGGYILSIILKNNSLTRSIV